MFEFDLLRLLYLGSHVVIKNGHMAPLLDR